MVNRITAVDDNECSVNDMQYLLTSTYIYFLQLLGFSATRVDKFRNLHVMHTKIGIVIFTLALKITHCNAN